MGCIKCDIRSVLLWKIKGLVGWGFARRITVFELYSDVDNRVVGVDAVTINNFKPKMVL